MKDFKVIIKYMLAAFVVYILGLSAIMGVKASIANDEAYCLEQTTYEYNDCIVKIQG